MSQNSLALQMHNGSSEYKHEGKKDSFKNVILRSITNQMSFNLQLTVGQLNVQRMRKIQVMLLIYQGGQLWFTFHIFMATLDLPSGLSWQSAIHSVWSFSNWSFVPENRKISVFGTCPANWENSLCSHIISTFVKIKTHGINVHKVSKIGRFIKVVNLNEQNWVWSNLATVM